MDRFVGKIAVVTGASMGIGEKTTKELLKRKVNVVGLARNLDKLQALSVEVESQPATYTGKFQPLKCDITKEDDIIETFSRIKSSFGSIAILINNAAAAESITEEITTMKTDIYNQVFDTNLRGFGQCAREAVKLMTDSSTGGHIVNMNSVLGLPHVSYEIFPYYTASKKAARVFSTALRSELVKNKRKIKISNVSPGIVNTDMPRKCEVSDIPTDENLILNPEDVAKSVIAVLDTPPSVLISELTVIPQACDY